MTLNGTTWYNELNSKMTLSVDSDGNITGTYTSAVGASAGTPFPLVGKMDNTPDINGQAIGFVVAWTGSDAVTTWSGQTRLDGQTPKIITTWLLTLETVQEADWKSTLVGHDTFTLKSTDTSPEELIKSRPASHPL